MGKISKDMLIYRFYVVYRLLNGNTDTAPTPQQLKTWPIALLSDAVRRMTFVYDLKL